jgi:hypothetical protein
MVTWFCVSGASCEAKYCDVEEEVVHIMVDRKQCEKGKDRGPDITFNGMPPATYFLQLDSAFKVFTTSQNNITG